MLTVLQSLIFRMAKPELTISTPPTMVISFINSAEITLPANEVIRSHS